MIYECLVQCPFCGHSNKVEITENKWLMNIECQSCKEIITGKENPHSWNWVLCAYGSVPWLQSQEVENKLE